jgi:catechol 2,3-dioxygenase
MSDFGIAPPGFRLPDETHVGAVRLQVADLQRSIDYYETVLGLRVLTRDSSAASLGPHGDERVLVWLHGRAGARPVPRGGVLGLYHFAILVPDRATLGRFVAHLGRIGAQGGAADHFVSEALYLTDPDGLGIEVYADRPRSLWRHEGRQLHMTTEPLDVRGLVAAGGRGPWAGMPQGTVMGHVHLHVGDLERVSAFYHRALGFDKIVWEYPGALFMSAGGYHHHLGTNTWSSGAPAAEDQARLLSWDIVVPQRLDASAVARSLESAGHDVEEGDDGWSAADPWGTRLRVIARDQAR